MFLTGGRLVFLACEEMAACIQTSLGNYQPTFTVYKTILKILIFLKLTNLNLVDSTGNYHKYLMKVIEVSIKVFEVFNFSDI